MSELFASGRIADLILGFVVLEGIVLATLWRTTGRGLSPLAALRALLPGVCLLLALRGALVSSSFGSIALCLLLALLTHLADLHGRWHHRGGRHGTIERQR